MDNKKNKKKFTSEELLSSVPVPRAITKIAIPAIFGMLIMAIYNFVDTLFIGMLDSDQALAAVGVAFPIMTLMGAVGQVLGAGAAATIGRAFGYSDDEHANTTATTIIYTSFVAGFVFMVIGLVFNETIFKMFGATEAIMPYAKEYGSWMFVGAIFSIPNQTFNNIARAETKALLSMAALMTGAIANIILDPIFMFDFGFGLGIEGASIATTISQGISFIFIAQFFFRGKSKVKVTPKNFKPTKRIYAETLKSGAPVGVSQLLSTFAVSATNLVAINLSSYGDNMVAAYGIVLKVLSIVQYALMGFLQGYQPIASYSYGAKDKDRFFQSFKFARNFVLIYTTIGTVLVQIFAAELVSMFSDSEQIITIGTTFLKLNNSLFIVTGLVFLAILTFQATGNGKYGSIVALSRQGFLYIPLLIILTLVFGDIGIFFSQPIADVVTGFITFIIFKKYMNTLDTHFLTNNL